MRDETRQLLNKAIEGTIESCKQLARVMLVSSATETTITGLAWSIAQGAALVLREQLEQTPEGRELIADGQRKAAGKLPS